jgi:AraC family transcriptional regulator
MAKVYKSDRGPKATVAPSPPQEVTIAASTQAAGWDPVLASIVDGRWPEFGPFAPSRTVVSFLLSGTTTVEWKRKGRLTRYLSEPGSLTIVPAGEDHQFRTDRLTRSLLWEIEPSRLQEMAEQSWGPRAPKLEIEEGFKSRDAEFWSLGRRLAALILAPMPGAQLYAESLDTQIALHLLWNHSSLTHRDQMKEEPLTDARLRRVIDFIHASLGNEISLNELADIAGLSPNYFLGAFKKATGKTPHRYLTEERVAKARVLLENPHHSLVSVALAVGFSSQSHLTTVFRKFLRTTPAAYRDEVLGLQHPQTNRRSGKVKNDPENTDPTVRNGSHTK